MCAHCTTYLYAELPLEPSLSRTLIEANEYGCLSQALTVAAMLSAETNLLPGRSKNNEKKRKYPPLELPDGSGFGDHIQLLQIYECWDENDYDIGWCKDYDLQMDLSVISRSTLDFLDALMTECL
ncbi:hypothetical protein Gohar_009231 [Gossypium harknessii]|uniref:RNA helicase n=1 Tax=Gossypium harknessii TaxID=34285 RepID=A0A7J9GM61_9ROSI|nr:hypothetical protein [Gossypium harknessii]